jgi:hypothetical protein
MLTRFREQNWRPSREELRRFGFMLAAGMPVSALLWFGLLRYATGAWHWAVPAAILAAGGGLGVLIAAVPVIGGPFYRAWYFLVCCIDTIIASTLLSVMYYLVLSPIALALRAAGRKPLRTRPERHRATYWEKAERPHEAARYFRQF